MWQGNRKGLLSCLLALLPHDPYQKCEREGGWDVYILHNSRSPFSFEPMCVCLVWFWMSNIIKKGGEEESVIFILYSSG